MAMFTLLMLMTLTLAFASLGTTEPVIGRNHLLAAQTRVFAESGLELALWALANPGHADGIPGTLTGGVAPEPYNGTTFFTLGGGGFTVRVTDGLNTAERLVVARGWTPTADPADTSPKTVRTVQMTFTRPRALDPPCALCIQGGLTLRNRANIDARTGHCAGVTPVGGTATTGTTTIDSSDVRVYGPGDDTANQAADIAQNQTVSFRYTPEEIAALRSLARSRGRYYQGSVRFDDGNPMPNGLVFVDTTTGAEFTASTPDEQAGFVEVTGEIGWSGWLIVAGSARITNHVDLQGLVYVLNDVEYSASGGDPSSIVGAVVAENRKTDATASSLEGYAVVRYDCQKIRDGNGTITLAWTPKGGSFREIEGQQ